MARFIGRLQGARGPASRLGTAKSGLLVTANGWHIGARIELDASGDEDIITLSLTGGSVSPQPVLRLGTFQLRDGRITKLRD